ncbi:hypothetical protein MNBD_CHLOROFLEXI01-2640 [hydrothermal vent metagenome]|uniref:N-acetyltransferase domain-containing protein n=1 Tax=hydrothermal vent metagenome TaxID=652676 RepID=A0A3B0UMH2_9ZZZZ
MPLIVRPETAVDADAIYKVESAAFDRPDEADLVRKLQQSEVETISLVAFLDEELVGHILFSPVTVRNEGDEFTAVALGPLAVMPARQKKGIGSELCRAGLAACLQANYEMVFVLGHSAYYPRFGFVPSAPLGLRCQFDVPEEAFMVAELVPGALHNRQGVVYYHPLFSQV